MGRRTYVAPAVVLGLLLIVGFVEAAGLVGVAPAGGGTFDNKTLHADGRRATPVNRWSHVALTYDGATLRLYVDGGEVSRRAITGTIRRTSSPLWIGGNHPYGEYFSGVIDEVRIFNRALSPPALHDEMSMPIPSDGTAREPGLVAAFAFDAGSGTLAVDASGKGNTGALRGPAWTIHGRYGGGMRFDAAGEVVRVPASASLDLTRGMTLAAWIRPSRHQAGWRTILHRQTDAYFLTAAGADGKDTLGAFDTVHLVLLIDVAVWLCGSLADRSGVEGGQHARWAPVGLFLAGSAADAVLASSATLIGPTLVALWYARIARDHVEAMSLYLLAAAFVGVSAVSIVSTSGPSLALGAGGVARSALGMLILAMLLLAIRRGPPIGQANWRRRTRASH